MRVLNFKSWLMSCLILCSTFIVWQISSMYLSIHSNDKSFDSTAWQLAAGRFESNERSLMLTDLLRRYKLVGMSRAQILELLGPASDMQADMSDSRYNYYLGPANQLTLGVDDEWLKITFKGNKVMYVSH